MKFEEEGQWEQAIQIDIWLHSNLKAPGISTHDRNAILVEIGIRLRLLSRMLISQISKSPTKMRGMWDAVKVRCDLTDEIPSSEERALGLVALCMTYQTVTAGRSDVIANERGKELIYLVSEMLRCLSDQPKSTTVTDEARTPVNSGIFGDPAQITRFLVSRFVHGVEDRAVSQLVRRVLLDVRSRSGAFSTGGEFETFLLDPNSPIWTAATGWNAEGSHPDDQHIPADILLIRGYRTPLQMAAESGNERVVWRLLETEAMMSGPPAEESGRTALQAAAGAGHVAIAETLLKEGANLNAGAAKVDGRTALQAAAESKDDDSIFVARLAGFQSADSDAVNALPSAISGRTALQAAAECGNIRTLNWLIELGAKVNDDPAGSFGRTALQAAAGRGHIKIVVRLLKDNGAEIDTAPAKIDAAPAKEGGRTALEAAVEGEHLDVVKFLLSEGAEIDDLPAPHSGRTALQVAAERGSLTLVQMLLDAGALVNAGPSEIAGRTALQAAVEGNHQDVVALLLDAKVDINAPPAKSDGKTVLQAAIQGGHPGLVRLILGSKFDLENALHTALLNGHKEVIDRISSGDDDVPWNVRDPEDMCTPLDRAVIAKHHAVVAKLLSWTHLKVGGHSTSLHHAVRLGDAGMVKLLAGSDNIDPNTLDDQGRTPLHHAIALKNINVGRQLLAIPGLNVSAVDSRRDTPLHIAVRKRLFDFFELLLTKVDSSVVYQNDDLDTPLMIAAQYSDHIWVGKLLEKSTAKNMANSQDVYGQTAPHCASDNGHTKVFKQLLDFPATDPTILDIDQASALHFAVLGPNGTDIVGPLLRARGADEMVKKGNFMQRIPLHIAAENGLFETVEMLLAKDRGTINATDSNNQTPLHLAAAGGHHTTLELLLAIPGIQINIRNSQGQTPLKTALDKRHENIVKSLLGMVDVHINTVDSNNQTALHLAVENGSSEIVEILLHMADVNINITDSNKQTALHLTAKEDKFEIIKMLLDMENILVNTVDSNNQTPLHKAARNGHNDVVILLLGRSDLQISLRDNEQYTAYMRAIEQGHSTIANALLQRIEKDVSAERQRSGNQNRIPDIPSDNTHCTIISPIRPEYENTNWLCTSPIEFDIVSASCFPDFDIVPIGFLIHFLNFLIRLLFRLLFHLSSPFVFPAHLVLLSRTVSSSTVLSLDFVVLTHLVLLAYASVS